MASHSSSSTTTTGDMLFACTNCYRRCKFEDLSSSQQLCKECRKQYPLVTCTYCRLEFHPIKNSSDKESRPACDRCSRDFKQYGTPSFCVTCNLQSAFSGKKCSRCVHSEKKYGPPSACEQCKLVCAFKKPDEVRKKVDGKTLCLLCTINYKKALFKKKNNEQKASKTEQKASKTEQSKGHHHRHKDKKQNDEEPAAKRLKLETSLPLPIATQSTPASQALLGRDSDLMVTANHMVETDKLQNEISSLRKQLGQKEQALREKDKQICQLKAELFEKDKEIRTKLQGQQKAHSETVENLQVEIRTLRKQLSQASQKKSSSSNAASQNSSLASLASSLAPNNSIVVPSSSKED